MLCWVNCLRVVPKSKSAFKWTRQCDNRTKKTHRQQNNKQTFVRQLCEMPINYAKRIQQYTYSHTHILNSHRYSDLFGAYAWDLQVNYKKKRTKNIQRACLFNGCTITCTFEHSHSLSHTHTHTHSAKYTCKIYMQNATHKVNKWILRSTPINIRINCLCVLCMQ